MSSTNASSVVRSVYGGSGQAAFAAGRSASVKVNAAIQDKAAGRLTKSGGGPRLSEPQRAGPRRAPVPNSVPQRYPTRCGSESRGPPTLSIALVVNDL